ncbi:hypothetical protein LXL04_002007 [Taraxacum kok-saghyz]
MFTIIFLFPFRPDATRPPTAVTSSNHFVHLLLLMLLMLLKLFFLDGTCCCLPPLLRFFLFCFEYTPDNHEPSSKKLALLQTSDTTSHGVFEWNQRGKEKDFDGRRLTAAEQIGKGRESPEKGCRSREPSARAPCREINEESTNFLGYSVKSEQRTTGEKLDEHQINKISRVQREMLFRNRLKEFEQLRENREDVLIPLIQSRIEATKSKPQFEDDRIVAYVDTLVNSTASGGRWQQ